MIALYLVIKNNYIHDIVSKSSGSTGISAVYLDGCQCDVTMEGNIVENVDGDAFKINGGRDNVVKNNIKKTENEIDAIDIDKYNSIIKNRYDNHLEFVRSRESLDKEIKHYNNNFKCKSRICFCVKCAY